MKKIIIIGGGGHAKVLIALIHALGVYDIVGILDSHLFNDSTVLGVPVVGRDEDMNKFFVQGVYHVCIGVGSVKDNSVRTKLFFITKEIGFSFPLLVHPTAYIAEHVHLSEGAQVMAGAILQPGVSVGENTIINTGAQLDHDCLIGANVHIAPGVVFSGECTVEDGAFVGVGATVIQGIHIGKKAVVAAGAVVVTDVPDGATVKGVPAK